METPYTSDLKPVQKPDYTYDPFKLNKDSILFIHPQNIYVGNYKSYIVKKDISWAYQFHNGYKINLKVGDEIILFFDYYSQYKLTTDHRYHLYHKNTDGKFERLGCLTNIAWDESNALETYTEYSIEYVSSLIKNLEDQLENKTPCYDEILNNQKPNFDISVGDTFIGFGWDNGLTAIEVKQIDGAVIHYDKQLMSQRNFNTYYGSRVLETTTDKRLIKYFCKFSFNFNDVLNDKVLYKDIIDESLDNFSKQQDEIFDISYKELLKNY